MSVLRKLEGNFNYEFDSYMEGMCLFIKCKSSLKASGTGNDPRK